MIPGAKEIGRKASVMSPNGAGGCGCGGVVGGALSPPSGGLRRQSLFLAFTPRFA